MSRCRVGWTRLVSSDQATPRSKSIQSPVPVKPVWPMVSSRARHRPRASPHGGLPSPSVRVSDSRVRMAAMDWRARAPSRRERMREVEHAVDGAEQPGMPGRAAQREGVLVMHLAADHPAAPACTLGRGAERRIGPEGRPAGSGCSMSGRPVRRSIAMPSSMKLMSE